MFMVGVKRARWPGIRGGSAGRETEGEMCVAARMLRMTSSRPAVQLISDGMLRKAWSSSNERSGITRVPLYRLHITTRTRLQLSVRHRSGRTGPKE
jgi:hypothetical protein